MYLLGEIFLHGNGVQVNTKEAFAWYRKAADNGNPSAAQKLSWCYLNGVGTRKNEEEGYTLLATLGLIGDEEALTLLRSAATSGNAAAELGMYYFYRDKIGNGCQQDIETAFQWISLAVGSAHPAVMGHLQQLGLNLEYLGHGCQQYQQLQSRMAG